ncbi:hypothetical protein ACLB2K_048342 [Fragaria x ananassa]
MEIVDNEDVASCVCDSLAVQPNKIPLYINLECSLSRFVNESNQDHIPVALSSPYEPLVANSRLDNGDDIEEDEHLNSNWDNESPMDDVEIETKQPMNVESAPSSSYRSKRRHIEDYENVLVVGQLYPSKKSLKQHLGMVAMRKNYEFKVKRSTSDWFEVGCVDPSCKWCLRATKLQDLAYFEVRNFYNEHSCSLDIIHRDHRQATSSLIGQFVNSKFEGGTSRIYKPRDIIDDACVQLGVNIGYNKAWRAREVALEIARGSLEESFTIPPKYCAMLERKNQGTITHIETDEQNHFLYFFMAIGASLKGFRDSMRPVIAIDDTFLKGKYFETILVVACQDGENQIYPLAFGVVDSENDASWSWFLTKLKGAIGNVENLVFISDRHGSIAKAVDCVFPEAHHGACIFHIANNLQVKFGKKMKILKLYNTTAKKYQVFEFYTLMEDIRKIKDGEICKYLEDIGYHKWARAHFMG